MKINFQTEEGRILIRNYEVFKQTKEEGIILSPLEVGASQLAKELVNYYGKVKVWNTESNMSTSLRHFTLKCLNGELIEIKLIPEQKKKKQKVNGKVKTSYKYGETKFNPNEFTFFAGTQELTLLQFEVDYCLFNCTAIEYAYFRIPTALLKLMAEQKSFDISNDKYEVNTDLLF